MSSVLSSFKTAIEKDFPIVELSEVAEQESWRKEINRPVYHIHKWWATRLGSVFRAITLGALSNSSADIWKNFYAQHDLKEKIVLDPFMGSGTTLGEALKLGTKAIGADINPISTFLVKQAFTRVSDVLLQQAFSHLEKTVAPEIRRYYQTYDPKTGTRIPVLYYFWCKTVKTPEGEEIPLMSRYVFSQDAYPKKKPRAQILCPNCWMLIEDRYDATSVTCVACLYHFNPQEGPASGQYIKTTSGHSYRIKELVLAKGNSPTHKLYAVMALRENGEKVYLPARPGDHALFAEAELRLQHESLPLPTMPVRSGHNTDQARGYNYLYWRDFFNARQLLCLGLLLRAILKIEDELVQEQMLCLFSGVLEFNNMFCSFKGEGTGAVRHMFSNHILKPERTPLENSVWGTDKSSGTFSTLFKSRLLKAKKYLDQPFELEIRRDSAKGRKTHKVIASAPLDVLQVKSFEELLNHEHAVMILNSNSACLPVDNSSVDAVVTDPPYFDFVHYSELSDFFFAWLSPILASRYAWMNRPDSSDKGEVQDSNPHVFANQLSLVFKECHRVLKDQGVLVFSFHHSTVEGWASIYEAITRAEFKVVAAHPVHAELRSSSPKSTTKEPISFDAILVCKKSHMVSEALDDYMVKDNVEKIVKKLQANGHNLSKADKFVVFASQMMVKLSKYRLSFESVCEELRGLDSQ